MTNLPNSTDNFQRVIDNNYQANTHKDLHNSMAETLEAVQKYSGSIHVNSLPAESEVGVVYVLKMVDGDNQPGIYLCITDDPTYLCLSSRGEGYVRYYDITDQTIVDINHGLNTIGVLVNALDSSMNQVEYDELSIIDENNIRILFTESFTGKVIVFSSGRDGLSPEHEWDGPRLRFKNPDGTWGEWVDLSDVAAGGPMGPMPEHEWNGTEIRFQLPGGSWGPWVNLRGLQGLTGSTPGHEWDGSSIRFRNPDGTWGSFVNISGPEGPGVVWKGTFSLLNTYDTNDLVKYGRSVYVCTVDGTTNILPSVTDNWDLYCEGGQDGSGAGSNLVELEAGENIECEQILTTSFAGTGNENLKVGSNIELTKAYQKSLLGFELYIKKEGNPIGPTYIKIYDVIDGVRADEPIKTWTLLADSVTTNFQYFRYMFDENTLLTGDKDIVLSTIAGDDDNYFVVNIEEYREVLLSAVPVFVGNDGKLYLSQIAPARQRFNGMCFTPVLAGQLGTMTMFGLQDSFHELNVGSDYYLSGLIGQISTDFSAIKVGVAVSDQEILMEKQTNFVNSSSSDLITIDENGINLNVIDPDNPVAQTPAKLIGGSFEYIPAEVLVVAGGGGGAGGVNNNNSEGGGGGAGEVYVTSTSVYGTNNIVVGSGGNGSAMNSGENGSNGADSSYNSIQAKGGGGGGGAGGANGKSGGSGGGGGRNNVSGVGEIRGVGGLSTKYNSEGYGNDGITNGRGGGANTDGSGVTIWGSIYGAGGARTNSNPGASGGANTGNGGEGSMSYTGGNGGSGVVVVRYLTADATSYTVTGGIKTTDGDYTYHTFTTSGTLEITGVDFNLSSFTTLGAGDNDGKFTANIDGVEYEDIFASLRIDSGDDFSSDLSKWTITQGGSSYFSIISGKLHVIDMDNNQDCRIELNTTFSPNLKYIFEWNNVYLPSSNYYTCSYIFGLSSFYFSYDADGEKIYIYENNSNVQQISMDYNSTHSFKIEFLGDGKALFYIDGSLVRTGTYTASTTQTLFISIDDNYLMSGDLTFEEVVAYRTVISCDEIATELQRVIRAATSNLETVIWDTDHFEITSTISGKNNGSSVLKLQAPTTGTDISGAGYLDLGANATEVAGDGDDYKLVRLDEDGLIGGGYIPGLFGDGSDGDVVISSNTSLTRDMYYNTLIINDGIILNSNGYRIFVKKYTTFNGTGKIASNGGDGNNGGRGGNTSHSGGSTYVPIDERANGGTGGVAAYSTGTLPIPNTGGNGGNGGDSGSVGSNGSKVDSLLSIGVASSAGGSGGSSQTGGTGSKAGGTSAAGTITNAVNRPRTVVQALNLFDLNGTSISQLTASAGGGGGGGGGGWYNNVSYSYLGGGGGGAGGSGGVILLFSKNIHTSGNNIFLQAKGGKGGDGGPSGCGTITGGGGGGAGGSGGCIIVFGNIVGNGLIDVSGGVGGVAGEGGNADAQNGYNGVNGIVYLL